MKIALDVMGGDNAPDINVDGAKRALQDFPLIEKIYLVGREETVRSSCDRWGLSGPRVEIVPAAEVVEMNESGLLAVRKKKNSSMSISVDLVKSGDADAVVSAGKYYHLSVYNDNKQHQSKLFYRKYLSSDK